MSLSRDRTHRKVEVEDSWHGKPYECDRCGKPAQFDVAADDYVISGYCKGMKQGRPKQKSDSKASKQENRAIDTDLSDWIREQPCMLSGQPGHTCRGDVVPHHVEHRNRTGDWKITSDGRVVGNVVPLDYFAHQELHDEGRTTMERAFGVDFEHAARKYGEEAPVDPPEMLKMRAELESLQQGGTE